MRNNTRSAVRYFFWLALGKCLPAKYLSFPYFLGKLSGFLAYQFGGNSKKMIADELKLIFPEKNEKNIQKIICSGYVDFYTSRLEQYHYPHLSKENVDNLITIEGQDLLEKALAKGKGVIALHPHFGSYLLIIPALGYNGYTVSQIALRGDAVSDGIVAEDAKLNRFGWMAYQYRVTHFEDSLPGDFINVKNPIAMRKVFRKLKSNEVIAVSGTGRSGQRFLPVNLCNRQALLSTGPFEIGIHTGAVLLPMFVVRSTGRKHTLMIEPPIELDPDGGQPALLQAVQKFADHISAYIGRYPHQFALRLARMKRRAGWDDHPFFTDYAPGNKWKRHIEENGPGNKNRS